MPDYKAAIAREAAATSAKHYVSAARAAMAAILRPFDLGSTQWWILQRIGADQEVRQRDLAVELHVERATASEIVLTLVRKGLVEQHADRGDQRQKVLRLTGSGSRLLAAMPDPLQLLHEIAFDGVPRKDLATVAHVLDEATRRLQATRNEGEMS